MVVILSIALSRIDAHIFIGNSQFSQMGNFKHQPIRDREARERERDLRDKDAQDKLRSVG
jgi:hypothetical protein